MTQYSTGHGRGGRDTGYRVYYAQRCAYDPLDVAGADEHYLLLDVPFSVDDENDPSVDVDRTTQSFDTTVVDAERINVTFYQPHRRTFTISEGARMRATVEASDNCVLSSVRYRLCATERDTGDVRYLTGEEQVGEVGGAGTPIIASGPGVRRVNVYLDFDGFEQVRADELLGLIVEVWGYQEASDATPSWVTLWHSRALDETAMAIMDRGSGV